MSLRARMIFLDSFSARFFFIRPIHFHSDGPAGASLSRAEPWSHGGQGGGRGRGAAHAASSRLGTGESQESSPKRKVEEQNQMQGEK